MSRDNEKGTCCNLCQLCNRIICFGRRNAGHSSEKYDCIENDYQDEKKTPKFDINFNDNSTEFKGKEDLMKSVETFPWMDKNGGLSESSVNYNILPDFIPNREYLTERLGLEKPKSALQIELSVKRKYKSNSYRVPHLICDQKDSLWFSSGKTKVLQKVKFDGVSLVDELVLKIRVQGLDVSQSNDILIVTKDSRLKQINGTTGKLEYSKYNVAPFVPIAVHVAQSGHVLVGATDTDSKCVMVEFNQEGVFEKVYAYDNYDNALFNYPCRITSTRHTIAVVDRLTDDKQGQVIVLGKDGSVILKYARQRNPFKPVDIVTTPMDNILVADRDNHFLHILDSVGNLKVCLDLQNHGITYPLSLAYNTEGQLYIGCASKSTKPPPKPAKLYHVTLPGC